MDKDTKKAAFIALAVLCGLLAIAAVITAKQVKAAEMLGGQIEEKPISVETIVNSMCIVVRTNGIQYCPISKYGVCQDASSVCGKTKKG